MLFLYLVVNFLTLCILETPKQVLWQILKTKMTIVFHFSVEAIVEVVKGMVEEVQGMVKGISGYG